MTITRKHGARVVKRSRGRTRQPRRISILLTGTIGLTCAASAAAAVGEPSATPTPQPTPSPPQEPIENAGQIEAPAPDSGATQAPPTTPQPTPGPPVETPEHAPGDAEEWGDPASWVYFPEEQSMWAQAHPCLTDTSGSYTSAGLDLMAYGASWVTFDDDNSDSETTGLDLTFKFINGMFLREDDPDGANTYKLRIGPSLNFSNTLMRNIPISIFGFGGKGTLSVEWTGLGELARGLGNLYVNPWPTGMDDFNDGAFGEVASDEIGVPTMHLTGITTMSAGGRVGPRNRYRGRHRAEHYRGRHRANRDGGGPGILADHGRYRMVDYNDTCARTFVTNPTGPAVDWSNVNPDLYGWGTGAGGGTGVGGVSAIE